MDELFNLIEPLYEEISAFLVGTGFGLSVSDIKRNGSVVFRHRVIGILILAIVLLLFGVRKWS